MDAVEGLVILGGVGLIAWLILSGKKPVDTPTQPRTAGAVFAGPLLPDGRFFTGDGADYTDSDLVTEN